VQETKISAILWLAGILVAGSVGWMWKQMRDSARILRELKAQNQVVANAHGQVLTKLDCLSCVESRREAD
jgi:hypothetical protein